MDFAITNTGKAKNVLKKVKLDQQIAGGNSANMSINLKEITKEISSSGKCGYFEALDEAGRLLKESLLTRSTAHKVYDFSSIQSESSLKLQMLYNTILENKYQKVKDSVKKLDNKTQKEIDSLIKKMFKSLDNAITVIQKNPQLLQKTQEELNSLSSNKSVLDRLDKLLPNNITFSDDVKGIAKRHLANQQFKKATISGLAAPVSAVAGTMLSLGGLLALLKVTGVELGFAALFVVPVVGVAGGVAGLVAPLLVAAGFLVAGLVVLGNKEKFGTIAVKKEIIKINDEFGNAVRYINKAADLVRKNAEMPGTNKDEQEVEQAGEREKVLADFITAQQKLWKPYTTAEGRKYTNTEDSSESGTHKSILRNVKNAKTSSIGKMKLGIAKTWAEIKCH